MFFSGQVGILDSGRAVGLADGHRGGGRSAGPTSSVKEEAWQA